MKEYTNIKADDFCCIGAVLETILIRHNYTNYSQYDIINEFEKDVLKGMLDHWVTTLYVMARNHVTGTAETQYGINTMQQPGSRSIIEMVSVFKLEVIPTQICPQELL